MTVQQSLQSDRDRVRELEAEHGESLLRVQAMTIRDTQYSQALIEMVGTFNDYRKAVDMFVDRWGQQP